MVYYENHAAASGKVHNIAKHEDAVEDVFRQFGLEKVEGRITLAQRDEWMRSGSADALPDNSFLSQPCGTHHSPDFIVKMNGKLYFIECKSVKGGTPMYNSGVPKPEYIYVLCSKKHDETTAYWGRDVLEREHEKAIHQHIAEARRRDQDFNERFANDHGISYYTRPMIQHKGSKEIQDYFLNPQRKDLEQRVLDGV